MAARYDWPARGLVWSLVAVLWLGTGCAKPPQLMPTPNLFARGDVDPFLEVPAELQSNKVDVLYVTDRAMEQGGSPQAPRYGYGRSRSVAFGTCQVQFGKDVSWDQLVKASLSRERSVDLPLSVVATTELGRFPPTPRTLVPMPGHEREADEAESAAEDAFRKALSDRLVRTRVKEVYVYIHGYNNDFSGSVQTIAQLWHFFGRQGVPVAYTWPAGSGGLIRGYTYDRESGEFTVYHLKRTLQLIASCPEVSKVNILAHSRGTDVLLTALRELHLQYRGAPATEESNIVASDRSRAAAERTRKALKLGTVVLAAPDIDVDVVIQRMTTVRLGQVPERFALYVCRSDKALGISNWLFRGSMRAGRLSSSMFTIEELEALRASKTLQIVDARVSDPGPYGHSYFHANPAVSSDLILLMRYQLPPGAEYGRPLRVHKKGFWVVDDDYPGPVRTEVATGDQNE
jgi:esterase/lipase superfamily enzyme